MACGSWASFHSRPTAVCHKMPVSSNVRPQNLNIAVHQGFLMPKYHGCASMNPTVATTFNTKDMANTAFAQKACAHCKPSKCKTAATVQLRQQSAPLIDQYFSCWLALRASVLRRAVSSPTRPALHRRPSSVTVGREALPQPSLRSSLRSHQVRANAIQIKCRYKVCSQSNPWQHSCAAA